MREPYWGYFNDKELEEWFEMWEEQLYYEENICSLKSEKDYYDYVAGETNKFSKEYAKNLAAVKECGNEEDDQKCTM